MSASVPQGVEVLVRKAAVDETFRAELVAHRAAAAELIGLTLSPAETAMLNAVPAAQLEAIIARTTVPEPHRRAFLGQAAAAMIVALAAMPGTAEAGGGLGGIRPDGEPNGTGAVGSGATRGIQPDRPPTAPEIKEKTVADRVIDVVAKQFRTDVKKVTPDASFVKDLKASTSQMQKLKSAVEQEFKIELQREKFKKAQTVSGLIALVEEATKAKTPGKEPPGPEPAPRPIPRPTPPFGSFGQRP